MINNLFFPLVVLPALLMLLNSCVKTSNDYAYFYPEPETVKDIDGNVYHTVYVKGQTWMVENLKTTRYNNGDTIPNVSDGKSWRNLKTGAYCNYGNDTNKARIYGRLYNWHAVKKGILCPHPWHVPYDYEWQRLTDTLGGTSVAGGILKETGTAHWLNNQGATNYYGFTARPGGFLDTAGMFRDLGLRGSWWSSTEFFADHAWQRSIGAGDATIERSEKKEESGFSVRCIRDY